MDVSCLELPQTSSNTNRRTHLIIVRSRKILPSRCVVRKYRRLRRKRCLREEYYKLRSLLPSHNSSHQLKHKVGVVDAAYRYICDLQAALVHKLATRGVPTDLRDVVSHPVRSMADVQALAIHIIQNGQMQQLV